ncbi:hypothetical protein [Streptomyces sp. CBMA156]|uniref:hypothetical protein n=1 Tax=Streptomyces sp. CBMA156 TaxID=1930280 RepID=UPI0016618BB1|nr:hypothetical protein [Streptomyces sp. CBMA156]
MIELRSVAWDCLREEEPSASSDWPGGELVAAEYAVSVASAALQVRWLCSRRSGRWRPSAREVLGRVWASADEYGRLWMARCFRNAGRAEAVEAVRELAAEYGPSVPTVDVASGSGRGSVAGWCEDIVLAGLADIRGLASASDGPVDWRLIADIAGACHRMPFQPANLAVVPSLQFPPEIADGWTRDRPAGRAWVRERSAGLPYRVPRSVRRTLDQPEPADLGDPLSLADARALVWACADDGLIEIGFVALGHLTGEWPRSAAEWPKDLVESEYVVSVASVIHHVRLLCSRRSAGSRLSEVEVMARVWASADVYGRHWLTRRCRMAVGGRAAGSVSRLAEEYGPAVPSEDALTAAGRGSVVRWCEDIVLAGLADMRRLASVSDGPVDWERITDILGVCYVVPFPRPNRPAVSACRYPRRIAGDWSKTAPGGRDWVRERSVGLPYRVPRSIRRTLEVPDREG